jgi:hypothetical protein
VSIPEEAVAIRPERCNGAEREGQRTQQDRKPPRRSPDARAGAEKRRVRFVPVDSVLLEEAFKTSGVPNASRRLEASR